MKKLYYLIILTVILGLALTGCTLLSNISQVPATEQSGIAYLTKGLPSGLVGLWHFDEGSGDTAFDSSNGNVGTLTNMDTDTCWVTGKFGKALSFDGINDYVDFGSNVGSFVLTDPFTIEAWINPALDNTDDVIYGNAWAEPGYHVRVTSDNKVRFILISNGSNYWCIDSSELDTGWHHIAAVWDGITYPKIYVDGVDDSHIAITGGTLTTITTTANTKIGLDTAAAAHYFDGTIDEVRIWDIALQPDDILRPAISVEKEGPEYAHVGDIITYDYTVSNTGYVPLSNVTVIDDKVGNVLDFSGDDNTNGLLDLEEDWIFTADYIVPSDVVSPLVNTATASGTNPLLDNDVVEAEASWSVVICYEETAWAYGEEVVASPNNEVDDNSSNAWGWTNYFRETTGFPVELALWAAAGQNNTDNGFLVGTVTVDLVDDCVTVDYLITNTDQDYMITEAHLWIGNTPLPIVKQGKKLVLTSAPGQFPFSPEIATNGESATIEVCEVDVENLDLNNFWVAAHAVIEWCEGEEE